MYRLTCKNHRGAEYLTKNPYQRSLHFVKADPEAFREGGAGGFSPIGECPCDFADLVVTHEDGVELAVETPAKEFTYRSYN